MGCRDGVPNPSLERCLGPGVKGLTTGRHAYSLRLALLERGARPTSLHMSLLDCTPCFLGDNIDGNIRTEKQSFRGGLKIGVGFVP